MSLYSTWTQATESFANDQLRNEFWNTYLETEKLTYKKILSEKTQHFSSSYSELAQSLGWDVASFIGFLDGINTSLTQELNLDGITEDTLLDITIDWKKLYENMIDYKATWLYTLEEWDNIFDENTRKKIKKEYNRSRIIIKNKKIGRNEPCPCGSSKKYKNCCLGKN